MKMIEYTFIRSKRKSVGISVKPDGSVIVRAPLYCSKRQADAFVNEKQAWIEQAKRKMAERRTVAPENGLSKEELAKLKKQARITLTAMVEEQAKIMGVTYGTISIRAQKTRWGSCSSKGNLNFNCYLMLLPENIQRYVVVHELCHRREMNHSRAFWREVEKYRPTYKEDRQQLRIMGSTVLRTR